MDLHAIQGKIKDGSEINHLHFAKQSLIKSLSKKVHATACFFLYWCFSSSVSWP